MSKGNIKSYPIYLDNAASTPMDEQVIQAMLNCLSQDGTFGNSASKDHVYGWEAAEVIENARDDIANAIGASPLEIIFTSGATESNNLAIRGLAYGLKKLGDKRRHIITTAIEHKAVLENCHELEGEYNITYLKPQKDGTISNDMLEKAMQDDTFLVSIAHANSVLGSMNDIHSLAQIADKYGAYFHSDCAQSNALFDLELKRSDSKISMVSLTPEKIYGPKGIGAIYLKRGLDLENKLSPLIIGGGHEKNLRGGTLATHQIAAMGCAFKLMHQHREEIKAKINQLRLHLIDGLSKIDGAIINGYLLDQYTSELENKTRHLPGIVSVSFNNLGDKASFLIPSLRNIACSSGSACSSKELKPSYVLSAIGHNDNTARASLRLSIGKNNTLEDIDNAIQAIAQCVDMLKN